MTRELALRRIPEKRGRLMNARTVAREIFGGQRSPAWVKRNVPYRCNLGHSTVMWFEDDVWRWVNEQREGE